LDGIIVTCVVNMTTVRSMCVRVPSVVVVVFNVDIAYRLLPLTKLKDCVIAHLWRGYDWKCNRPKEDVGAPVDR
jgi:hypothetical protein